MKKSGVIVCIISSYTISTAIAGDTSSGTSVNVENYFGYGAVALVLLLLIGVILVLSRVIFLLSRKILKDGGGAGIGIIKKVKPAYLGLNANSNWFLILMLPLLGFTVIYLLVGYYYPGTKQADNQSGASVQTVVAKNPDKEALITENTVKLITAPAVLDSGRAVFALHCSACHGDKGQGIVGPNLTDDYWLHGGKINEVFKTISLGYAANGMPEWDKQLSAQQISDVANFVESLHGTNPTGAKAPQGIK